MYTKLILNQKVLVFGNLKIDLTIFIMISKTEQWQSIQDQLEKIAAGSPQLEKVQVVKDKLVVETDPALPEAELIAQKIAETILDPGSFVNSKENERIPESVQTWEDEIAWKLYPSAEMRTSGLSAEIQSNRQQKVIETLNNKQPLELDLGILWVGEINPDILTINELAVVKNIVGLMEIVSQYQKKDAFIKANLKLKIAVEPILSDKVSQDDLQKYIQKLLQLAGILTGQSEIDQTAINIEISTTQTNESLNLENLTRQITDFWIESEEIYKQKATELDVESWQKIPTVAWISSGSDSVDKNPRFFYNKFLQDFAQENLFNLESYKNIPEQVMKVLGILTPNFKEALLKEVAILKGLVSEQDAEKSEDLYKSLMNDKEFVKLAIETLAIKIKTIIENDNQAATLHYQFGDGLTDAPETDVAKLRHLGNLNFNKLSPWRTNFAFHRTMPSEEGLAAPKSKSIKSTPEKYGLRLRPTVENPSAIDSVAKISIGELVIEVPIHYLLADWFRTSMKKIFEGQKHE